MGCMGAVMPCNSLQGYTSLALKQNLPQKTFARTDLRDRHKLYIVILPINTCENSMILTYKIKHDKDFSNELRKAKQIADFAVENRSFSSKDVKHIGLKSVIANQILRKYGRNKAIKSVKSIKLIVPNQSIKVNKELRTISIPSLKLLFGYLFPNNFNKINQIEIGIEYIYVSVSIPEKESMYVDKYIGVDLNTTGHVAVIAMPETGKILKLGREAEHIHNKYKAIRKDLQEQGKYKKVKAIKNRESRIVRDLNHKISKKIVETAIENNSGIKLEALKGIRNNKKHSKSFNYSLNSWSFYQLQKFIEYKANLQGIPVVYIEPAYTSKKCSICGHIGIRNDKQFKCPDCGHVDHADVNAAFNISVSSKSIGQSTIDRDIVERRTDTLREATA